MKKYTLALLSLVMGVELAHATDPVPSYTVQIADKILSTCQTQGKADADKDLATAINCFWAMETYFFTMSDETALKFGFKTPPTTGKTYDLMTFNMSADLIYYETAARCTGVSRSSERDKARVRLLVSQVLSGDSTQVDVDLSKYSDVQPSFEQATYDCHLKGLEAYKNQ